MKRRILVSGSTGLVGREVVSALAASGAEVIGFSRHPDSAAGQAIAADILAGGGLDDVMASGADTMVHAAWDVSPGYWTSAANDDWRRASSDMVRRFRDAGGRRVVLVGTCAEYDWSAEATAGDLSETGSRFRPHTPYGMAKYELRRELQDWSEPIDGFSVASGLVFFPFGGPERPERLVPSIIRGLLAGEDVPLTSGNQVRDLMHVASIGRALAALASGEVSGPVNIATGAGTSLRDVAGMIRSMIPGGGRLEFGALPDRAGEPLRLVADVSRLRQQAGYREALSLEDGMKAAISYWRDRRDAAR